VLTTRRAAGGVLVLVGAVALWQAQGFPMGALARPGPGLLPAALALVLIVIGAVMLARGGAGEPLGAGSWRESAHALGILGVCALVALLLERLGWRLTVTLALLLLLRALERRSVAFAVALTAAIALGSFWLFDTLLKVPLPRGPFGI
jgi:putative tricarboxylic transport membrane protein